MEKVLKDSGLPQNVATYIEQHDGVNLAINYNSASADYGYAHMLYKSAVLSKITRTCNRCGYDPLWRPDDSASKCNRHSYSPWRYDEVFAYSYWKNPRTLEECFGEWEQQQPQKGEWNKPAKLGIFGEFR